MQKNNCIAVLQGPKKKNRTWKRTTALQKCPVPASKTGHAKEQLHYTDAQSRQAKPDMQKNNCIAMLQGPGKKKRTTAKLEKEQLHCMSCPVLASQNRSCKKIIALQCCQSSEEKSENCTALLPGVRSKTGHALEQMHFTLTVPGNISRTC